MTALLVLAAALAFGGGAPKAGAGSVPALDLKALSCSAVQATAAPPTIAPKPGELWLSQDVARNRMLQALADGGAPHYFAERDLLLWGLTPFPARGGQRVQATFSSMDIAAPRSQVEARLKRHADELRAFVADKTGVAEDDVLLEARPLKDCCGAGCRDCLRSKKGPARFWTNEPRKAAKARAQKAP